MVRNQISCTTRLAGLAIVLLYVVIAPPPVAQAALDGLSISDDLSHFFGRRKNTDTLCYQELIQKGSRFPQVVQFTPNVAGTTNNFITVTSDRYKKEGFRAFINTGAIATVNTGVRVDSSAQKKALYNILVSIWCGA